MGAGGYAAQRARLGALAVSRRALVQAAAVSPFFSLRTAQADESGTLTVALSNNPVTCDPINMSSHDTELLSQTIWENRVEFDIHGKLRPQLAKELPEVSANKLVYTFELRDDVAFQNGQSFTSEDVKVQYRIHVGSGPQSGPCTGVQPTFARRD